ncbi:MAG TPA: AcrB/AcrD/AcrF family protein [Allosphingosinicella sp.]|nr:AcrB/AcrD/AcrF family protein [Allosphingosinicella sp.]
MPDVTGGPLEVMDRHWRWWLLVFWLVVAGYMVYARWGSIHGFGLSDTDDNMRMMQVRGLIAGQGWYDLEQHRLAGSNIHWSRLVDLPIAALKLIFSPLFGGRTGETIAVAAAPLLPMLAAMAAVSVMARRLIAPIAFPLAIALLACAGSAKGMWYPMRIDHHGWQLAMLAWAAASLTDPKRARGGVTLGAATALSLAIGMEMLLYLAACGAIVVLLWVRSAEEARRLFAYGVTLAGGCAFAFLIFASEANRAPVCDALSPVWLSAMAAAGAIAVLLAWWSPRTWAGRLGAAAGAGALLASAFAWTWPHCLGRLEQSSPELERLWLSRVREAMPIWRHGARIAALTVTLPIAGLIGYGAMLWRSRRDPEALIPWASVALLATIAAGLLCWQTRAGPAAQILSIPGATALVVLVVGWAMTLGTMIARVAGAVLAFLVASGLFAGYVSDLFSRPLSPARRTINIANNRCPTLVALRPVARLPRGRVLTFVDLGPRLITVTPHDAITGPYHRNAVQIIDVMRAWRGDTDNARRTVERYRVDYVLICPNLSESTLYRSEAPHGFYMQLARDKVPEWLAPVPLPADSPYRMWRVVR